MLQPKNAFASFSVDDLEKAREFYANALGLDATIGEMGTLDIKLGGGAEVMAYSKPNHEPATYTILNFVVPDVEEAVDKLTSAGVAFEHYDMPEIKTDAKGIARGDAGGNEQQGPSAIAWFRDPAGNIISLIQE
jgi:catechol 2,3-dioxygenase-like lactoylglutathione lyase family enzyme